MFANPEVPIDSLPPVEQVQWQPLDARYLPRLLLGRSLRWLIVVPALAVAQVLAVRFAPPEWTDWRLLVPAWALLAVLVLGSLTWPFVSVPRRGYAVRDKDILYKSGVCWRMSQVVPFNRVQHATTSHAPLDRRFGLATLTVFTAGGGGGGGALGIEGLGAEVAERLRVYIVGKLRGAADAEGVAGG